MRTRWLLGLALASCLLEQGCAGLGRFSPGCPASDVLQYSDRVQSLPPSELAAEHAATQRAFAEKGAPGDRFRLVFQLLAADAPTRDEARAVKLLTEYLETANGDSGLRALARLLVADVRRQWELEGRAREATRRQADEKTRADLLRRQLDELKEIERIMNERQKR